MAESLELDPDHGPDDRETLAAWAKAGEQYSSEGKPSRAAEAFRNAALGYQSDPTHGPDSATTQPLWALALHARAHAHPMLPRPDRRPTDEKDLDHTASRSETPDLLWDAIDHHRPWQGTPRLTAWLLLLLAVLDAPDLAESLALDIQERSPGAAQAVADHIRAIDNTYLDEPGLASANLNFLKD